MGASGDMFRGLDHSSPRNSFHDHGAAPGRASIPCATPWAPRKEAVRRRGPSGMCECDQLTRRSEVPNPYANQLPEPESGGTNPYANQHAPVRNPSITFNVPANFPHVHIWVGGVAY